MTGGTQVRQDELTDAGKWRLNRIGDKRDDGRSNMHAEEADGQGDQRQHAVLEFFQTSHYMEEYGVMEEYKSFQTCWWAPTITNDGSITVCRFKLNLELDCAWPLCEAVFQLWQAGWLRSGGCWQRLSVLWRAAALFTCFWRGLSDMEPPDVDVDRDAR